MEEYWYAQIPRSRKLDITLESGSRYFQTNGEKLNFDVVIENKGWTTIHEKIEIDSNLEDISCDPYDSSSPLNGIDFNEFCARYATV